MLYDPIQQTNFLAAKVQGLHDKKQKKKKNTYYFES